MGKLNFEYLKCKNWNVSIQFESEDEHLDEGTLKKSAEFLSGVVRSAGSYKIRVRRRPKCDLNINSIFSVSLLVSIKTAKAEWREISKFSFSSLNCHFWGKIIFCEFTLHMIFANSPIMVIPIMENHIGWISKNPEIHPTIFDVIFKGKLQKWFLNFEFFNKNSHNHPSFCDFLSKMTI